MNKHMLLRDEDRTAYTENRWCSVLADHPGVSGAGVLRFAVRLEGDGGAAIGFAEASSFKQYSQNLGAAPNTWAISKTGKISCGDKDGFHPFAEKLGPPDVIGAEADLENGTSKFGGLNLSLAELRSIDQIVITAQAKPDYKPTADYHVPQPGEVVPNFHFINQSGRTRYLHEYRGRVLLITFIYTRCPLADFCVRMSRNFATIDKSLNADPALYAKTHLLSISFDPAFDTPSVLRSYGGAFTGRESKETFAHWEFAATPQKDLAKVEQYFDLGVTTASDKTLSHSLSTMVVGSDGKVVAWYPNNEWTPQAVEDVMRKAVVGI
jgi:cytochrome oxidase Cu insertion factor (SCO1/SenC/PrrC family)